MPKAPTPELGEDPEILDESGLTLDAIPWFTGALIIGAWLGFDHSGQGPEIRTWAFDPEIPKMICQCWTK